MSKYSMPRFRHVGDQVIELSAPKVVKGENALTSKLTTLLARVKRMTAALSISKSESTSNEPAPEVESKEENK